MSFTEQIGAGRPVRIRVFLEGIEVPCISVQISSQPNAPAQCVLQLPPAELGTRLLPRTLVHVFFLDSLEDASNLRSYRGSDANNPKPSRPSIYQRAMDRAWEGDMTPEEASREERNRRFKLLFCGEVIGFQWAKTALSRSLVLQCLDLSNYWDYAYQFNNTDIFGPGIKAVFSGGATNLFTDFLSSPGEIMAGILKLPSANYPSLKGALGGLIRVIESIGGCYQQGTKFQGQNVFFSLAELRLKISLILAAYPEDQTIPRLLSGGGPDAIFGRTLGNLGEQVSIRTVFNAIAAILFHETYAVPAPYLARGDSDEVSGAISTTVENYPGLQYVDILARQVWLFCQEMTKVLQGEDASKGTEDQITDLIAKRTRQEILKDRNLVARRIQYVIGNVAKVAQRAYMDALLRNTKNKKVKELLSQIRSRLSILRGMIVQKWAPTLRPPQTNKMVVELNKIAALAVALRKLKLDVSNPKTRVPNRLHAQIVKPDVWFGAPPRCNVLFPHHIFSLNYSRTFMREPTRLLLKTYDEFFGEDELFDKYMFAPRSRTMRGKRHRGTLAELFSRDLLEHELYTGILPIFTKMGEFNILALRGQREAMKKPQDRPKISLAQRTANFLYFKNRFASRSMTIQGIFNPWLAPGFPGLVIDRYVRPEDVETYIEGLKKSGKVTPELRTLLGTHFLGSFANVSHSLSPTSAETNIEVQYPREYDESAEFLGPAVQEDQRVIKRFGTDALRTYTVAALEVPKKGSIGIHYGTIEEVQDITETLTPPTQDESGETDWVYKNRYGKALFTFPVYTGTRRSGDPAQDGTAPIGVPVRLGDYSPKLSAKQGPNTIVTFRAFRIKESIPRYRREKVDLPAEEAIRPGWYDDIWHPAQIGRVYQTFFETGSITDMTQIGDPDGVSVGDPRQLARDQLAREATGNTQGDNREGISPAILTLDKDSSIQQAVDFLLMTYAYIQQNGLSAQRFTDAYTWRPIAALADIFGSSDLELDPRGIDVVRGMEGFHSRAFGPYDDLFGLVTPEVTEVLGAKKTDQMRSLGDVRGRKHQAVLDYVEAVRQVHRKGGMLGSLHASTVWSPSFEDSDAGRKGKCYYFASGHKSR